MVWSAYSWLYYSKRNSCTFNCIFFILLCVSTGITKFNAKSAGYCMGSASSSLQSYTSMLNTAYEANQTLAVRFYKVTVIQANLFSVVYTYRTCVHQLIDWYACSYCRLCFTCLLLFFSLCPHVWVPRSHILRLLTVFILLLLQFSHRTTSNPLPSWSNVWI